MVLLGNGDGTFESARTFPSGGVQPAGLADPDFDKDGDTDLAVANSAFNEVTPNNITVLENVGGDFKTKQTVAMERGQGPTFLAKGNFHRGGHPDLVVSNAGADTVTLLVNKRGVYESTQPNGIGRGDDPQGIMLVTLTMTASWMLLPRTQTRTMSWSS